jgi:hypothetical protein
MLVKSWERSQEGGTQRNISVMWQEKRGIEVECNSQNSNQKLKSTHSVDPTYKEG